MFEFTEEMMYPVEILRIFNEECLKTLGDPYYQEKVWLQGIGPEVDSIENAISSFLVRCSAFIEKAHIQEGLNPELTEKLTILFDKVDQYWRTSLGQINDEEIARLLADSKWHEIQKNSKELYELIRKNIEETNQ